MTVKGQLKEDTLYVHGPRGGRYSLQDWISSNGEECPSNDDATDIHSECTELTVKLPDVRNKVKPSSEILLEPVLAYVHYALQSGTAENIKRAVTGFFTEDVIMQAKVALFDKCDVSVIGSIKHRREGDTRSRNDANCKDIIESNAQAG